MAFRSLKSFFPTADDLLRQDLPKLGEILLVHLKSYEGLNTVYQQAGLNRGYFRAMLENRGVGFGARPNEPEYGASQPPVTRRMMEAWNWLEREGLLIHNDQQVADWFSLSTAGEELLTRFECFERWERLGLDRVKSDLMHNEGRRTRQVGGGPKELDMAWEWVRMKEAKTAGSSSANATRTDPPLLDEVNKLLNEVPKGPLDSTVAEWWGGAKNVIDRWNSSKSVEGSSAEELFFSNLESVGRGASERRRGQQQMDHTTESSKARS